MLQTTFAIILTLVLFPVSSFASPHSDAPQDQTETVDESPVDPLIKDRVVITPVKATGAMEEYSRQFSRENYFYNHREALTLHSGMIFGFRDSSGDPDLINGMIGVSYLLPWNRMPKTEVGADLSLVGNGHLTVMQRKIFNYQGSFRPYYRYGLMLIGDPHHKLAGISDWEKYLGRAGVGFEDIRKPSQSFRIELEVAAGMKDLLGIFSIGYVWGL